MIVGFKQWIIALALTSAIASCGHTPPEIRGDTLEQSEPAELVRARRAPNSEQLLDVAIKVFDVKKINPDSVFAGDWIFQEILEIESQYLPTVLRQTLVKSNQWGVVRVLPIEDLSMDLTVLGSIIRSDGVLLELHIEAKDSTDRQWLNKNYSRTNSLIEGEDPFQDIYDEIANDLLSVGQSLAEQDIKDINRVSDIRHASDLSPDSFSGLLEFNTEGLLEVTRLLANNDPMLKRVARMRSRHNVFIDTLDDYYQELNLNMQPVYDLWRYYSREQILEVENEVRKDLGKSRNNSGFTAIANNYYRYKANKIFEQEWAELAEGFTQELEPQILDLNNQVYSLTGSVEDQYVQWRKILKQFYLNERGL